MDLDGKDFVKIELDWDYKKIEVHLSMEPYLQKALHLFNNAVPKKRQDSPYPHIEPKYGAKQQFTEYDISPAVGKDGQKHIQQVNGKFLWYGRASQSYNASASQCTSVPTIEVNATHHG